MMGKSKQAPDGKNSRPTLQVKIPPTPAGARNSTTTGPNTMKVGPSQRHPANTSASASRPQSDLSDEQLLLVKLMGTMKETLARLESTFNVMLLVTEVGPALEAAKQIAKMQAQIEEFYEQRDGFMKNINETLRKVPPVEVAKGLEGRVRELIKEKVAIEVPRRVRAQLDVQISDALRLQSRNHRREMLDIECRLHNSEARRQNALIRPESPDAPFAQLRPLLLPLQGSNAPPSPLTASSTAAANSSDFKLPMPSPLFPKDLKALLALKENEVRLLVGQYGLSPVATSRTPLGSAVTEKSREDHLNAFIAHIGLRKMHLTPGRGKGPMSPLVVSF